MTFEELLHAQHSHSQMSPTTPREWADWWFKAGELHGRHAAKTGSGRGAATDCYYRAHQKYVALGDHEAAAVAEKCADGSARLIGSGQ